MTLLADRTAVVTGAASGIGRSIATTFARYGADVVCADIRSDPKGGGQPTLDLIEAETDAAARFVECDVTSREDQAAAVGEATDTFGGIDCMVNCAGVSHAEPFLEVGDNDYEAVMEVNATGVFLGSQLAARAMRDQGSGGSIVNVGSIAASAGSATSVPYSASKGAVRSMTYAMANQLRNTGIRVNAIQPGVVYTSLVDEVMSADDKQAYDRKTPLDERGAPEHVAGVATFLASDLSSFVNAESIVVDGGLLHTMATDLVEP